jgi:hypothetical protein
MEQSSNHTGCWVRNSTTGQLEFTAGRPTDYKPLFTQTDPRYIKLAPLPSIGSGDLAGTWDVSVIQSATLVTWGKDGGDYRPNSHCYEGTPVYPDRPERATGTLTIDQQTYQLSFKCTGGWCNNVYSPRFKLHWKETARVNQTGPGTYSVSKTEFSTYQTVNGTRSTSRQFTDKYTIIVTGNTMQGHRQYTDTQSNIDCLVEAFQGQRLSPVAPGASAAPH